ncbi:hypothetical protein [Vibrio rotiferianus]|uniref:hypothetical protein n=1 Tax=Vibrio rotiferianus TaxID=190895 RepID=UPI0015F62086|nr:hypothetical protein [Vibrio rotiferianus]
MNLSKILLLGAMVFPALLTGCDDSSNSSEPSPVRDVNVNTGENYSYSNYESSDWSHALVDLTITDYGFYISLDRKVNVTTHPYYGEWEIFSASTYHKVDFTNGPKPIEARFVQVIDFGDFREYTMIEFNVEISNDFSTISLTSDGSPWFNIANAPLTHQPNPSATSMTVEEIASLNYVDNSEVFQFNEDNNLYVVDDESGCDALLELHQESNQLLVDFGLTVLESSCDFIEGVDGQLDDSGILIYQATSDGRSTITASFNLNDVAVHVDAFVFEQ